MVIWLNGYQINHITIPPPFQLSNHLTFLPSHERGRKQLDDVKTRFKIGQEGEGRVTAKMPAGDLIDINAGFPTLLETNQMPEPPPGQPALDLNPDRLGSEGPDCRVRGNARKTDPAHAAVVARLPKRKCNTSCSWCA
jgi:hypothetical protein